MVANPSAVVYPDAQHVDKALVRGMWADRVLHRMADATEVRATNLDNHYLIIVGGVIFQVDTADTTTADDGINAIIDNQGNIFKRTAFGGLDVDAVDTFANRSTYDDEPANFIFLAKDTGNIYVKLTASSGDWSTAISLVGPPGTAGPVMIDMQFNTATSGDPGSGKCLVNVPATPASITVFHISETDRPGTGIAALLEWLDNSTSAIKARVLIRNTAAVAQWLAFDLTTVFADGGAHKTATAANGVGGAAIANDATCAVFIIPNGDKGDTGDAGPPGSSGPQGVNFDPDEVVALIAGRAAHDGGAKGLSVLVESDSTNGDLATLYFKLSATSADWSAGVDWAPTAEGEAAISAVSLFVASSF